MSAQDSALKGIKVVTFDLDGVFFSTDRERFISNFSKRFSLDKALVKEVLFEKHITEGDFTGLRCGKIPSEKWWQYVFGKLGLEDRAAKQDYLEELANVRTVKKKVARLINTLHCQKVRVATCSNNYRDNIEFLKQRFSLDKYFDVMVFSYEVGVLKPDPRIFQELINRTGVKPEEIVYTDDKEENLQGALGVGIRTSIYKNLGQFKKELKGSGIAV